MAYLWRTSENSTFTHFREYRSIPSPIIVGSSPLLHCEQRSLRQRKVARLAYDSEHGKLWQDIKADLDKTRASKFADAAEWAFGKKTARVLGVLALFAVVVALLFLSLHLYGAPNTTGPPEPDTPAEVRPWWAFWR